MEITFLGTGSAYPTPTRGASCIIFRLDGKYWMFDCGEGSQIQLMRSAVRAGKISKIFITHLHGDHMFGLPGLMCTISQRGSNNNTAQDPIELYGPVGLRKFLRVSLELSRSQLGFDYIVHELKPTAEQLPDDWQTWSVKHEADESLHPNERPGRTILPDADGQTWIVCEDDQLMVKAGKLKHRIPCFGYVIEEKSQPGKINVSLLRSMGVQPGPLYAKIKAGEAVTAPNGQLINPCDVIGPSRPGRKLAIFGDSCDSQAMAPLCLNADVIVHEATLANEMLASALEKGHSTPDMAGRFAQDVNAGILILTHFSQRFKSNTSEVKEDDETTEILRTQALKSFTSGQVITADDFTVVSVPVKSATDSG